MIDPDEAGRIATEAIRRGIQANVTTDGGRIFDVTLLFREGMNGTGLIGALKFLADHVNVSIADQVRETFVETAPAK